MQQSSVEPAAPRTLNRSTSRRVSSQRRSMVRPPRTPRADHDRASRQRRRVVRLTMHHLTWDHAVKRTGTTRRVRAGGGDPAAGHAQKGRSASGGAAALRPGWIDASSSGDDRSPVRRGQKRPVSALLCAAPRSSIKRVRSVGSISVAGASSAAMDPAGPVVTGRTALWADGSSVRGGLMAPTAEFAIRPTTQGTRSACG